jgi:hypothetical protein
MRTRDELENLINGSPLFSIDRVADGELFAVEERRFLNDLAELMSITRKDFAEVGFEIIQTAKACIKAYKADGGVFLHYFNVALKKTLFIAGAKEMARNSRGGMTIDEKTEQTIRQIIKHAKISGKDVHDQEFQSKVAAALDLPLSVIAEAIAVNDGMAVRSGNDSVTGKDGDGTELFDFVAATIDTPDGAIIGEEETRAIVEMLDAYFRTQQERTKALLGKLLTARIIEVLEDFALIQRVLGGIAFVDAPMIEAYITLRTVPTARQIAEAHGVAEQSASRTLKSFIDKVREKR